MGGTKGKVSGIEREGVMRRGKIKRMRTEEIIRSG